MRYLLVLSILFFTPSTIQAADSQASGTRINISTIAETSLPNDEVVIIFRVEKQGKNAKKARHFVNKVSRSIEQRLKQEKDLTFKTINRNMQPIWHYPHKQPRVRTAWRLTQSGQITSTRLDAVPLWLDAIEAAGAHLSSLQFRINKQTTRQTQEKLRLQAIQLFRQKATAITQSIDGKSFRIIRLNTNNHIPQPMMRHAEMALMSKSSASSPPPSLSVGEGSLRVSVSGEIEVPFTRFSVK